MKPRRTKTLFISLVFPAVLLAPAGCGDDAEARDARRETREAIDAIKKHTDKEIKEMTTTLKNRWADLQTDLDKLKAEAQASGAQAKAELQKQIAEVEAQIKDAKTRLDAVAEAGKQEASESLSHLEKSYESAKAAVQDAWKELRNSK